jgi:hypothetical protein
MHWAPDWSAVSFRSPCAQAVRDSCGVDLLGLLLQDPREDARRRLRDALDSNARPLEEITFNIFEVTLDRDANEARIFDVLDGSAEPTVMSLDELRHRLR